MEFPAGFQFKPTDVEIIEHYLLNKVKGKPFPYDIVSECELYNKKEQPWKKAFQEKDRRTEENTRFFFTKVKKISKNGKGKKTKRTTGSATWKSQKTITIYNQLGKVIGTKKAFSYIDWEGSSSERWVMHEYNLDGEYKNLEKEVKNYVLCKVTRYELFNKAQINSKEQQSTSMIIESDNITAVAVPVCNELNGEINESSIPNFEQPLSSEYLSRNLKPGEVAISHEFSLSSSQDVVPAGVSLSDTVYHLVSSHENTSCNGASINVQNVCMPSLQSHSNDCGGFFAMENVCVQNQNNNNIIPDTEPQQQSSSSLSWLDHIDFDS